MHDALGAKTRRTSPKRILSQNALSSAWKSSRDSKSRPGKPGVDEVTATRFRQNLDANLSSIHERVQSGTYKFKSLFPAVIDKPGSSKKRIICIPTVSDRLVQRAIVSFIYHPKRRSRLKIFNASSFGFLPERGVRMALDKAIALRNGHQWVLKTDIQSFFDLVPRKYLKERVEILFRGSSILPLLLQAVDCEIKAGGERAKAVYAAGIRRGVGIRQGMPLSPVFANIALIEFDRAIEKCGYRMIRYADDILLFFDDKAGAESGLEFVKQELAKLELTVPAFEANGKTKCAGPQEAIEFLGREIKFDSQRQEYYRRLPRSKIDNICQTLRSNYDFAKCIKDKKFIGDVASDIVSSLMSYDGIYSDIRNRGELKEALQSVARQIVQSYFHAIFRKEVFDALPSAHARFLGVVNFQVEQAEVDPELG
jgi:RNA-directed DNA polymerase